MISKLVAAGERPHAVVPLFITWSVLGAVHALAWHYEFPASWKKPNEVWRVASLMLTGVPVLGVVNYAFETWLYLHETQAHTDTTETRTDATEKPADAIETPADTTESPPHVHLLRTGRWASKTYLLLVYGVTCRLILVGLMLGSLSSLPSSAYQVIPWTEYIPHL